MARIKTNNSYLADKARLRLNNLPDDPSVLDCYGGAGLVWEAVKRMYGKPIKYLSIDKIDYGIGFYLPGDNMKYLGSMDLSPYNIIDLDAYGCPYGQLKTLFERGYSYTKWIRGASMGHASTNWILTRNDTKMSYVIW